MSLPSHPLRHHMTVTWRSCQRGYAWHTFEAILPLFLGWFCISLTTFMSTAPKIAKLDMATSLTECPEFSALQSHYEAASKFHMRALFEGDTGRFEKFRYNWTCSYFIIILFCSDWPVVQLCFLWPCGSCHNNSLCNEIAEVKLYLIWIRTNVVKVGTLVVAVFCFYVTSSTTCIINVSFLQQAFTVELKRN